MDVIGVGGQAQNGKDTLSDYLRDRLNEVLGYQIWQRSAFAKNVKKVFCDAFGVDAEFIEKWKVEAANAPGLDMPLRPSLQFVGDGFRKIKENIWVDMAFKSMTQPTIISDVRYANELKAVRQRRGVNILVVRPDRLNDDPNESEAFMRTLADWCLTHLDQFQPYHNLYEHFSQTAETAPMDLHLVDFVVFNNSTIEAFYQKIDLLRPELEKLARNCHEPRNY